MTPQEANEWIRVAAFICGLVVGALAVASTSIVWLRKSLLTVTACWLASLGTVLIGMSIWQTVEIEGHGFRARLAEIEERTRELETAKAALDKKVAFLATFESRYPAMLSGVIEPRLEAVVQKYAVQKEDFAALKGDVGKLSKSVDYLSQGGVQLTRTMKYSDFFRQNITEWDKKIDTAEKLFDAAK